MPTWDIGPTRQLRDSFHGLVVYFPRMFPCNMKHERNQILQDIEDFNEPNRKKFPFSNYKHAVNEHKEERQAAAASQLRNHQLSLLTCPWHTSPKSILPQSDRLL